MLLEPADGLVGKVFAQVVLVVVWRLDRRGVLVQARLPLRRLAGDEAIEMIETVAGRPTVERSH